MSHAHACRNEGSKELSHMHIYVNMKAEKSYSKYTVIHVCKIESSEEDSDVPFFFLFCSVLIVTAKKSKILSLWGKQLPFFFFFFFRVRPAEWKKKNCNFKRVTNFSTHRNRRVHQRKIILIPQSLQSRRQLAPQRMHRGLQLVQCDLQLYKRDPCRKTIAIKRTFEKKKICGFFFFYLCFFVFVFFFVFFGWWLLKLFYFSWERYEKKNYCNLRAFII